jgi:hypothetical protein
VELFFFRNLLGIVRPSIELDQDPQGSGCPTYSIISARTELQVPRPVTRRPTSVLASDAPDRKNSRSAFVNLFSGVSSRTATPHNPPSSPPSVQSLESSLRNTNEAEALGFGSSTSLIPITAWAIDRAINRAHVADGIDRVLEQRARTALQSYGQVADAVARFVHRFGPTSHSTISSSILSEKQEGAPTETSLFGAKVSELERTVQDLYVEVEKLAQDDQDDGLGEDQIELLLDQVEDVICVALYDRSVFLLPSSCEFES